MTWQAYLIGYLVVGATYAAHDLNNTEMLKGVVEAVLDRHRNDPETPGLFSDSWLKWFTITLLTLYGLLLWPLAMAKDARRFIRRHRGGRHV